MEALKSFLLHFFFLSLSVGICDILELLEHLIVTCSASLLRSYLVPSLDAEQIPCAFDGGQTMCDDQHGQRILAVSICVRIFNCLDSPLYLLFALWIKSTCRFIQYENLRILQQRSCNGKPLLLSTRQIHNRACPDERVQASFEVKHKLSIRLCQS